MLVDRPLAPYATTNCCESSDEITALSFVPAAFSCVAVGVVEQGYAQDQNTILPVAVQEPKPVHTPTKYVVSDIASAAVSRGINASVEVLVAAFQADPEYVLVTTLPDVPENEDTNDNLPDVSGCILGPFAVAAPAEFNAAGKGAMVAQLLPVPQLVPDMVHFHTSR